MVKPSKIALIQHDNISNNIKNLIGTSRTSIVESNTNESPGLGKWAINSLAQKGNGQGSNFPTLGEDR